MFLAINFTYSLSSIRDTDGTHLKENYFEFQKHTKKWSSPKTSLVDKK